MSGVNKVILVGRLGADPDVRSTATGQQVCTLSVATSETWMKDGKREERTEWHRVILWARQAELAQKYLKKGRMVYLEGKLQTRSWQDPQGQKRYTTEIVASNMQFIDGNGQSTGGINYSDEPPVSDGYYGSTGTSTYDMPNQPISSMNNSSSKMPADDDIPF